MQIDPKCLGHYENVKKHLSEKGQSLGFTPQQLEFVIEAATMMANVMVMTPPTDTKGNIVRLAPNPDAEIKVQE